MQNTIKKIIEMDKDARRLTDEARERRAGSATAADCKRREVFDSYLLMARNRVDTIRKVETRSVEEQIAAINSASEDRARVLRDRFKSEGAAWVEELVLDVTQGDDLK